MTIELNDSGRAQWLFNKYRRVFENWSDDEIITMLIVERMASQAEISALKKKLHTEDRLADAGIMKEVRT